jgi:predicted ester cyclase
MIADGYKTYQWLHFNVGLLVVDETQQTVASRLILKGTDPNATDVPREHVIYRFKHSKISEVWSMLEGFDS